MKSIKRLFTLALALAMVISSTVVASAASVSEEFTQEIEVNSETTETTDSGIMPLSREYYIQVTGRNQSNGSSYNDDFYLQRSGRLVTNLIVIGKATITVDVDSGHGWGQLLRETVNHAEITKISVDTFPAGTHVRVSVKFEDQSDYALQMWGEV